MKTIGEKICEMRKENGMTQEALAEKLNVSAQAVSKWETNLSIPDLPVLISLADLFGVSLDELCRDKEAQTRLMPVSARKSENEMVLRVRVDTSTGDKVKINLPIPLFKAFAQMGDGTGFSVGSDKGPGFSIGSSNALQNVDFGIVLQLIEQGVMGKLMEVESADGDTVEIYLE